MAEAAADAGPAPISGVGPIPLITAHAAGFTDRWLATSDRFGSVTLTLRRPLDHFAGVMMADRGDASGLFVIALARPDGFAVGLGQAGEEDAIVLWREQARRFGLPMVIWSDGVGLVTIEPAERPGAATPHRRRGASPTRGRRPRFLRRRKAARLPLHPVVHGGDAARFL